MRKAFALALLLSLSFTAQRAQAQISQGLNEVNAAASFSTTEGFTVIQISGFAGRFITPQIELGPRLTLSKVEGADLAGSIGAFGAYHFGAAGATTVPFAGALIDIGIGDGSSLGLGGFGGAKFFLNEGAAITAQGFVTFGDVTTVGAQGGVSIFF